MSSPSTARTVAARSPSTSKPRPSTVLATAPASTSTGPCTRVLPPSRFQPSHGSLTPTPTTYLSTAGLSVSDGDPPPARDPACGGPVARRALSVHEVGRRGPVPARPELCERLLLLLWRDGLHPHRPAAPPRHPAFAVLRPQPLR